MESRKISVFDAAPWSYFFSSVEVDGGAITGGVVVLGGVSPRMPSLKLRTPSPKPFITSGIFFPPNIITMTAAIISKCIGVNASIRISFACCPPTCTHCRDVVMASG